LIIEQSLKGMTLCRCFESDPRGCDVCGGTGFVKTGPVVTSRAAKADILTPWKLEDRQDHEIYTSTGIADPAVRKGMFNRAWNRKRPDLNSRDGHYPCRRAQSYQDDGPTEGDYYLAD
jgi:hypothetical protein